MPRQDLINSQTTDTNNTNDIQIEDTPKTARKADGDSMPKVRFLPLDVEVEVPEGKTILDAALDNNIKIDHNCGGNCACSTCHVIVEEGFDTLGEMTEDEEDMLDEVEELHDNSRLACQCKVTADLIVRIPPKENPLDDEF